jgi:hypothetical protein
MSLEQLRALVAANGVVRFAGQRRDEVYGWMERTLVRHEYAILQQFLFVIHGFHSDNGSEFINYTVARLLEKLLIEQTRSRPFLLPVPVDESLQRKRPLILPGCRPGRYRARGSDRVFRDRKRPATCRPAGTRRITAGARAGLLRAYFPAVIAFKKR